MQTKFVSTLVLLLVLASAPAQESSLAPDLRRVLAVISPSSLRGNLSFIASEQLEGRDTPSRGLDLAALYIAAQFRRAGLQPAGDDGYFQTAKMLHIVRPREGFELRMRKGGRTLDVSLGQMTVVSERTLELNEVELYKIDDTSAAPATLTSKIVVWGDSRKPATLHPAAFLETANDDGGHTPLRLIDWDEEKASFGNVPRLIVRDAEAIKLVKEARKGDTGIAISVKLTAPTATPVTVRNVAGLLRGSDAALRDQYVLVTAHEDHLGRNPAGEIFPGANDDGSGTVSVIEIAQALATMNVHPKRSILFMTFFGEEEGSLGSDYYTQHPLFPLERTVADLNLEQLGRTDSSAGPEVSNATLTGFRYSTVARTLQAAGRLTGIKVYDDPRGDEFFDRSDNQTFAEHGIPAHTLVVAFEFPDYHATGDVWQKIDYRNLAKVDRMIALGVVMLADDPERPRWNRANPKTRPYLKDTR